MVQAQYATSAACSPPAYLCFILTLPVVVGVVLEPRRRTAAGSWESWGQRGPCCQQVLHACGLLQKAKQGPRIAAVVALALPRALGMQQAVALRMPAAGQKRWPPCV